MAFNLAAYLSQTVPGMGILGAVVGGSAAAAKGYADYKRGLIDKEGVLRQTGKEAAGAGVATAVSAAVVGVVGGGLLLSLGTAFASAAVAKYAWDRSVRQIRLAARAGREELAATRAGRA